MRGITIFSLFHALRLLLTALFCFIISTLNISAQEKLSKADQQKRQIDATFSQYEEIGYNTADTLKFIYHFSDRDRIPIIELSKGLEKEFIETISYYEKD